MESQIRSGLVFQAQRLLYHSTLGLIAIKKMTGKGRDLGMNPVFDSLGCLSGCGCVWVGGLRVGG